MNLMFCNWLKKLKKHAFILFRGKVAKKQAIARAFANPLAHHNFLARSRGVLRFISCCCYQSVRTIAHFAIACTICFLLAISDFIVESYWNIVKVSCRKSLIQTQQVALQSFRFFERTRHFLHSNASFRIIFMFSFRVFD